MTFPSVGASACSLLLSSGLLLLLSASPGHSQALHPLAYNDLGSLDNTIAGGSFIESITIDSSITPPTLQVSFEAGAPVLLQGEVESSVIPEVAVFAFTRIELEGGISITLSGSRPIALLSRTDLILASGIDVPSGAANGGAGGNAGTLGQRAEDGLGAGAGGAGSVVDFGFGPAPGAGGGAGYGATGAPGEASPGATPGAGGNPYGSALVLQGGSGGGGGPYFDGTLTVRGSDGGAGGGALELNAYHSLSVSAVFAVNGGDSTSANGGDLTATGGAGSGGMLRLSGATIDLGGGANSLKARGGTATNGSVTGGSGSGGRIIVLRGSGDPADPSVFDPSGGSGAGTGTFLQAESALDVQTNLEILHRIGSPSPSQQQLEVTNNGEAGSQLFGAFPEPPPPFGGGNQLFGGLIMGESESTTYTFTTNQHETLVQELTVSSTAEDTSMSLTGRGVGPTIQLDDPASGTLDFGLVPPGESKQLDITVANETPDGDLGSATDLTLLSIQITGQGSAVFSTPTFSQTVVAGGQSTTITVALEPDAPVSDLQATLTLTTDAGAALGAPGQTQEVILTGSSNPPIFQDGFETGDTTAWQTEI